MRAYVLVIAVTALTCLVTTPLIRGVALRGRAYTPHRTRDMHVRAVPKLGGVAMVMAVLVGIGDANVAMAGIAMLVAHALFKSTLFLTVGVVDHATGTRDLRVLSGLGRRLPVLAGGTGGHVVNVSSMAAYAPLQSMNAYLQMGWMPQMYVDAGASRDTASVALSLVGALNILGGLLMPTIIDRARSLAPFPLVFAVLTAAGYLGILLAPTTTPLLWAFLLGIGGFCFPTAIALIPARSRSPLVTARLSGFVQPMGYFLAGLGPFAIGLVYEATGSWTVILSALVVLSLVMGLVGVRAGRNSIIDDELTAPHWREYTGH